MTADESHQLLAFDYNIHLVQSRLPIILAALALLRDFFGGYDTKCYPPPEYVSNSEIVQYFNSYCIYEEEDSLIGYHEFIPFTFIIQAVLTQIPIFLWIACGGKKISMLAKWFSKSCRELCLETEAPNQTDNKSSTSSKDWPSINQSKAQSLIQSYINEWSAYYWYVVIYFSLKGLLLMFISLSFAYHCVLLVHTIEPEFLNDEFLCEIKHLNVTIDCVKPYEIFNQLLIIIDLLVCLTIPLILLIFRDVVLFIRMWRGLIDNIAEFIPYLEIPERTKRLNNTHLLTLYYKENIEPDDKYVQKILIPSLQKKSTKVCRASPDPRPKPKYKA
ncbi:uncharacterized protein LOC117107755 [Anneissia japonica]|uniref:uncharacterized protein LOC117107755 n=1 Tax=Anneissia japonica TaxID=1529436 RepID=UPI00142582D5|nr:uncharacterized protein LOC117107755 [Anneissia japonica]